MDKGIEIANKILTNILTVLYEPFDMLPSKRTVKKALNAEKGAFCMSRKNKGNRSIIPRLPKDGRGSVKYFSQNGLQGLA